MVSVQGEVGMQPVATVDGLATSGGASYSNEIAPATPAAVAAKVTAGNVYQIMAFNLNAAPVLSEVLGHRLIADAGNN